MTRLSLPRFVDTTGTWNRYSQFGEDAVTSRALDILGVQRGFVVEFGAGDGLHLSNTALYWRERAWPGLLIEPDQERYEALTRHSRGYMVNTLNEYVNLQGRNKIDRILKRYSIKDVALMSIDVDDYDYQIFAQLVIRPMLVLIEFNTTMPYHLELVGEPGSFLQSSPLALVRLAEKKSYSLLAITGCNCLFVANEFKDLFTGFNNNYYDLIDLTRLTYMVSDWHGRYFHIGPVPFGMREPYDNPPMNQL